MSEPRPSLLVVGGGMIGRAVVRAMTDDHDVTVIDPDPDVAPWLPGDVDVITGAVETLVSFPRADVVVWAAGVLAPQLAEDPDAGPRMVASLTALLRLLRSAPPRRLLLVSSLAVYGGQHHPHETTSVRPGSDYGHHKVDVERLALDLTADIPTDVTIVRCCGVLGPLAQPGGGWMQETMRRFVAGGAKDPAMLEGVQGQELLHVDDAADAMRRIATSVSDLPPVVNVGSGVVLRNQSTQTTPAGLDCTVARQTLGYTPRHASIGEIMHAIMDETRPHTKQTFRDREHENGRSSQGRPRRRVLVLAGSHRVGAYSTALARAVEQLLIADGWEVDFVAVADLDLPLHNPIDHRDPANAADPRVRDFAARVRAATAFVWVTPIYHGSYSSGLKNALDNINISLMENKPVAVMSHGGGRFGGSVIDHLRTIGVNLHADVLNVAVATNTSDFDETDQGLQLTDDAVITRLHRVVAELSAVARRTVG